MISGVVAVLLVSLQTILLWIGVRIVRLLVDVGGQRGLLAIALACLVAQVGIGLFELQSLYPILFGGDGNFAEGATFSVTGLSVLARGSASMLIPGIVVLVLSRFVR